MSDGRMKKAVFKINNKEIGTIMDLIDVRDELVDLMKYYQYLVSNADTNEKRYKASYSAVALQEAANLVTYYLKDRNRAIADDEDEVSEET